MKNVRLGIVGVGNMGGAHARSILGGKIRGLSLAALCDLVPEKMAPFEHVRHFATSAEMIRSGEVDAVLIATPHYDHTTIGIDALENGMHVMVEKPISVHKADALALVAAHRRPEQVFAAMFNQRTNRGYLKMRDLIQSGELGEIRRINWIVTDWFRSAIYYSSGAWRATWAGEGGGVLMNQCPHNLDMLQWLFGMPSKVRAFCRFGQYHDIEVEDEVTAWMEFPNGATGIFITSTGEAPGTNRMEVTVERGRLVFQNGAIHLERNEVPMSEYGRTTDQLFGRPETWDVKIPVSGQSGGHDEILQNFTDAILEGKPLIAPAAEGLNSVELANAMLLSTFQDRTVELPMDSGEYAAELNQRIKTSVFKKNVVSVSADDFARSFQS